MHQFNTSASAFEKENVEVSGQQTRVLKVLRPKGDSVYEFVEYSCLTPQVGIDVIAIN